VAGKPERRERDHLDPHPGQSAFVPRPARGYAWPPFEAENFAALRHGAHSPRKVRPVAEEIARALLEVAPWTARPAFEAVRASWAWVEAQLVLLRVFVDEQGMLDADGQPRPAVSLSARLESRASSLRAELGLTPQSLAKLLSNLASVAVAGGDGDGLASLKAEGARILAAREAALLAGDEMPGDDEAGTS
jgi:hypothetical protein